MLNTIEEAINAIRDGQVIIVVDDEDRENEGDMICASACITPELVNFMLKEARGLMCVAITPERSAELGLYPMVAANTSIPATAFTISVDLKGYGCTTGVSASDRCKTIKAMTDQTIKPSELGAPGHMFPLIANPHGVLGRPGHTEAAVELARLAGLYPSGVLIEVMKENGSMARLPELKLLAEKFDLKLISIKDLISFLSRKK